MSAHISICGQYRHILARGCQVPNPERPTAFFMMLNPSTADAEPPT